MFRKTLASGLGFGLFGFGLLWCGRLLGAAEPAAVTPEQREYFEKHIRPVLVERCFECHSGEGDKVRGNLRLDSREGWAIGGDSGPAIVPGQPGDSLLIQAVRYADEGTAMPPKGKIPAEEIAALTQWVQMGAPDPRMAATSVTRQGIDLVRGREHWAYQPIRVTPPPVSNFEGAFSVVDRYILAAQVDQGLIPSTSADRAVLIRRVYFDLIGLPPTPEEIEVFVTDQRPIEAALETVVDRLLASPRYGERWGRHWLDVVRYAESMTLRGFVFQDAWRYRDYVVENFNADRPFNQFIMEQVAGDLLPASGWQETRRHLTATAFLAIGNNNLEEQDKKGLEMDVVDEQLDVIGKGFLAQTLTCARCHDHKFDPIPTADYYALAGIMKSTHVLDHANISKWIERPLPEAPEQEAILAAQEAQVAVRNREIEELKQALRKIERLLPVKDPAPPEPVAIQDLPGIVVDDAQARKVGEWMASTSVDNYVGGGYVHDKNGEKGQKTVTFIPELPESGLYEVRLSYTIGANRATNVPVTIFGADGEFTIPVNQKEPGDVDGRFQRLGHYRFEKAGQSFVLISNEGTDGHVVADAVQFLPMDSAAVTVTKAEPPQESSQPVPVVNDREAQRKELAAKITLKEQELKFFISRGPQRARVISVSEELEPGDIRIHVRGSVHNQGAVVPRGFLRVLPVTESFPIPDKSSGRLQLAQWLAHPQNPLPARVMVNRIWHHLFGAGLVRTIDNFGTTGERPTHPDLLDYLADRYRTQGWSTKTLIKEIVMSRTYRQSSVPAMGVPANVDGENRLLARAHRRRLDAECIRDAILQVSGALDLTAGGPSYPPLTDSDFEYKHVDARRSVYSAWFRNGLPEILEVFDVADTSTPTGQRNVSTVSTQALFMLNHPWVQQQSHAAARRLLAEAHADDSARIERAYRLTMGRSPTPAELSVAVQFVGQTPSKTPTEKQAAWAGLFQSLFASIDFRYVE